MRQVSGWVSLTAEEMLEEWKKRKGFYQGLRNCEVEREDGVDLDGLLSREMEDWYMRILSEAPIADLAVEEISSKCRVTVDREGVAVIELPMGCVRVVSVRLSGWRSSCLSVCSESSLMARKQVNPWLRGGASSPVCVGVGRRILAYSAVPNAENCLESLYAVCRPAEGCYEFSERLWYYFPEYFDEI